MTDADLVRERFGFEKSDNEHVSRRNKTGTIIIRAGFFYTHGQTGEDYAKRKMEKLPEFEMVACGMQWKPFVGGSPLKKQSFWWVEVKRKPAPVLPVVIS